MLETLRASVETSGAVTALAETVETNACWILVMAALR